jgi:hypothetical protein
MPKCSVSIQAKLDIENGLMQSQPSQDLTALGCKVDGPQARRFIAWFLFLLFKYALSTGTTGILKNRHTAGQVVRDKTDLCRLELSSELNYYTRS